jgi:hypothetical protein
MDFYKMLDEGVDLLRCRQCLTSRVLKRQFDLDDDDLDRKRNGLFSLMYSGRPRGHTCSAQLTS